MNSLTSLITGHIYVAGHTGMLGSAIVRALEVRGYGVLTRIHEQLDLCSAPEARKLFQKWHPNYVFMAAGRVGGIQANTDNQAAFLADNTRMALNIIDACAEYGAKLCYIGSSCMYPRACEQPMKERDLLTGPFEPTNEGYALAKMVGLKYAQFRLPDSVTAIPCNLYGPGDNYDERSSHVFAALIKKFVDAKENGLSSVTLWGTGASYREFLHVDDCAEALVTLMENGTTGVINVGYGTHFTIFELASQIAHDAGYKGEIKWDRSKPNGMPIKIMDSSRISAMGWRPHIALADGIARTIAEYRAARP